VVSLTAYSPKKAKTQFKGILVAGSGNDEANPTPGTLNGAAETDLCQTAAKNGYVAAIVQYRKTAGNADWNNSAKQIAEDYDKCISALSARFGVDKSKSVVAGFSYASFMLLTDITVNTTLSYSKGVLAACGGADSWKAQNFKIPRIQY
jgi:dienelactone hydrolase